MANCPNCGKKLKLTDVSQYCPHCGVNMRFVNFEENFVREAKYAELAHGQVRVKFSRFKAAFIGSKLTIVRLAVCLLPLVTFLIPSGSFSLKLPYGGVTVGFGVFGLIDLFTGMDFSYFLKMGSSTVAPGEFKAIQAALAVYLLAVLASVVILVMTILCFVSIKKMQKVIAATAITGAAISTADLILIFVFAGKFAEGTIVSFKSGFGLIITAAAFGVVAFINLLLDKKGIPVVYSEGAEQRAELYKELKEGKIDLKDLPQPVVETEQTREIDRKIEKERENYLKAHEKEEASDE